MTEILLHPITLIAFSIFAACVLAAALLYVKECFATPTPVEAIEDDFFTKIEEYRNDFE